MKPGGGETEATAAAQLMSDYIRNVEAASAASQ